MDIGSSWFDSNRQQIKIRNSIEAKVLQISLMRDEKEWWETKRRWRGMMENEKKRWETKRSDGRRRGVMGDERSDGRWKDVMGRLRREVKIY